MDAAAAALDLAVRDLDDLDAARGEPLDGTRLALAEHEAPGPDDEAVDRPVLVRPLLDQLDPELAQAVQ